MTCFAPASRAIWMISFEVVPRTIESGGQRVGQSTRENLWNLVRTIDEEDDLAGELQCHGVELAANVLAPERVVTASVYVVGVLLLDKLT